MVIPRSVAVAVGAALLLAVAWLAASHRFRGDAETDPLADQHGSKITR